MLARYPRSRAGGKGCFRGRGISPTEGFRISGRVRQAELYPDPRQLGARSIPCPIVSPVEHLRGTRLPDWLRLSLNFRPTHPLAVASPISSISLWCRRGRVPPPHRTKICLLDIRTLRWWLQNVGHEPRESEAALGAERPKRTGDAASSPSPPPGDGAGPTPTTGLREAIRLA